MALNGLGGGLYTSGHTKGISQATLDFPCRVFASQHLSRPSINGSTVIIVGHSQGLTIIWRGGRRFSRQPDHFGSFELEEDDARLCPTFQQPIVHRTTIHLSLQVTALSLCALPPSECDDDEPPIIAAAACSDGKIRVFRTTSTPVAGEIERDARSIPTAVISCRGKPVSTSITWTRKEDTRHDEDTGRAIRDLDLLVAICTDGAFGKLTVSRLPANFRSVLFTPFLSRILVRPARKVSFSRNFPSMPRDTKILVCSAGSVSIFDPFHALLEKDVTMPLAADNPVTTGPWLVALTPEFPSTPAPDNDAPCTAARHQIVDAEWVAGGRGIMVLLANRQWGIWDRFGTSDKSFDFSGYLKWSRAGKKFASMQNFLGPMSLRREHINLNQENKPPIKAPIGPSRGGLSVTPIRTSSPQGYDECVSMWFNDAIYTIPKLRKFREQKSNFPDVDEYAGFAALGQKVSRLEVLPSFDAICVRHDLLIVTDTRLHLCVAEPSRLDIVTAREDWKMQEEEKHIQFLAKANQQLLAQGGLDLVAIDGTLNDMAQSTTLMSESSAASQAKLRREDSVHLESSPIKKLSWGKDRSKEFFMHESLSESASRAMREEERQGMGKIKEWLF
ncbi:hypothetical protein FKW77_001672 [Venturia effusa]|uniref:Uncharacterized protein n=1 Tax=Venturia effusa TaxID=50376 RepID=A0A517L6P2_9PEZI|nr:hypothetical protein FKW77_001672 [Venturia effusa]